MITAIKSKPDLQYIPVIIITAGKIDLVKYTSSGANEMFQKPLPLDQLLEKAEELVSVAYQKFNK
jgi:DNA-binding response OmpR family regulator